MPPPRNARLARRMVLATLLGSMAPACSGCEDLAGIFSGLASVLQAIAGFFGGGPDGGGGGSRTGKGGNLPDLEPFTLPWGPGDTGDGEPGSARSESGSRLEGILAGIVQNRHGGVLGPEALAEFESGLDATERELGDQVASRMCEMMIVTGRTCTLNSARSDVRQGPGGSGPDPGMRLSLPRGSIDGNSPDAPAR